VTYFTFHGKDGFALSPVPTPKLNFLPSTLAPEFPTPIQ
jgi:hypothetical protein